MGQERFSSYQKQVIRRYYKYREALATQKLSELVSDLFIHRNDHGTQSRLWKQAETCLRNTGIKEEEVKAIMSRKSLDELARLVGEMF
jgi:hypothetical protein